MTNSVVKNLGGRPTVDSPKSLKVRGIALEEEDIEWLKSLPHGVSYNVREAVRLLRQHKEQSA